MYKNNYYYYLLLLIFVAGCFVVDAKSLDSVETVAAKFGVPLNVSYDHRSLIINGERKLLLSASIHYPRATPSMWRPVLEATKAAGIDLIETYTFWNLHEPTPGTYNFEGNANVTAFLDICAELGLYVTVRFGPYVCAEWNYGGFPFWLKEIDGIVFRDYNQPFMDQMSNWMTYIVNYLRPYYASNGGPIILAQVENEYGWLEAAYGASGTKYALWAAQFANSLDIGIPWIMCSQDDIATVINTCNGFYCHDWIDVHWTAYPNQPAFWTENWPGWFQNWEGGVPHRPVQDVLYSVARWIAYGGSMMNYYMWFGGTTFGRWTGGPFITTSYDYDGAIDEYGYPYEPKYSQSLEFHTIIHAYEHIILSMNPPKPILLGENVEISHFYSVETGESFSFLANFGATGVQTVQWNGITFKVQPWSVQLLYNNVSIFDTSATPIGSPVPKQFTPIKSFENIGQWSESFDLTFTNYSETPMEQLSLTRDQTDYLWYVTKIEVNRVGAQLSLPNISDMVHVFVDNQYIATGRGPTNITLNSTIGVGGHTLQVLHTKVGLVNYAEHMEATVAGIFEPVTLDSVDISSNGWSMKPFVQGETLQLYNPNHSGSVQWTNVTGNPPLTWYKFNFNLELSSNMSLALDMLGMTKGMIFVNGYNIGRYWLALAYGCNPCTYQGGYSPSMCQLGCGEPSQQYYHVPTDWLMNGENEIVIFEEVYGNPEAITLVQRVIPYTNDCY
ncbi:glycoside hydrolase family 35 protein [Heterostelium album PN500]|uniref:Beta-galactosidase n=1 Tax=Heterostelium pallidum (strain ATCC 26659 / Pp 5 / PN500) TaxID=670386 RepID=D3BDV9_HETP5|nr:glycoside hydrolase family 35 protein [Heterostelium album PN500]EFA80090.1 glycoside hydrolase family 35 protein [Heterostelium album PN500]|eukprot:XP_020432210.1 glycoside hydrolase family 35 protein [Heterostelium album PN500]